MRHPLRSATLALIAAAALTASATSADAAFSFTVADDSSTRDTTVITPVFDTITTNPGPLYTVNGAPNVTQVGGGVIFDFTAGLSTNFASAADGTTVIHQSTDGRLVLDVHFDVPTSIFVNLIEGGLFSTTGNGGVSVSGGEFVVEAVNPVATESHASALTANFGNGTWTATAGTVPFTGLFTDYRIIVDNDLIAQALAGTASISKNTFKIEINVPEPASLSILGLAGAGLLLRRRR